MIIIIVKNKNSVLCIHETFRLASSEYVKDTQRSSLPHLRSISHENRAHSVILDAATRRNLEIDTNLAGGDSHTLFEVMDRSVTAMGRRLLRRWLHRPLTDVQVLRDRQAAIRALCDNYHYETLRDALKPVDHR